MFVSDIFSNSKFYNIVFASFVIFRFSYVSFHNIYASNPKGVRIVIIFNMKRVRGVSAVVFKRYSESYINGIMAIIIHSSVLHNRSQCVCTRFPTYRNCSRVQDRYFNIFSYIIVCWLWTCRVSACLSLGQS